MLIFEILFWLMVFIVFYTYTGYGMLLYVLVRIKRLRGKRKSPAETKNYEPEVTLFIAAYNEQDVIVEKMQNCLDLEYPREKLHISWVTDGSDDGTLELLGRYEGIEVHHSPQRNGKIGAMNRGMKFVKTPIVVFSDANTMLSRNAVRRITAKFRNPVVGCVSGEKRIFNRDKESAAGAGEGIYWKYESTLKRWDAELKSVTGAAGELFAIRTNLYEEMEKDTLLDDFMISMRIAMKGYTIQYDPEACATEAPSEDIKEEMKRKVRISAGGIQSVIRLSPLLNIFRYGLISFQYISHRVLRWTLAPLSLFLLIPVNAVLAYSERSQGPGIYTLLLLFQAAFYLAAAAGWYFENRMIRIKAFFIPYYFLFMNLSVFLGLRRLIRGSQTVNWARAKRAELTVDRLT